MLKLLVAGNLGKDAELKEVNGQLVIQFSIAINQNYKDANGATVEKTTWVNCSQWKEKGSKTGIVQCLKKGSKVLVDGTPEVQVWTDNQGNRRADLRCRIKEIHLLSSTAEKNNTPGSTSIPAEPSSIVEPVDDLPF